MEASILYAGTLVIFVGALTQVGSSRRQLMYGGAAFVCGYLVLASGWMARNFIQFGQPALTGNYAAYVLTDRLIYNRMTNTELGIAFIYWLPDFGGRLAEAWFPKESYIRLDDGDPGGFHMQRPILWSETFAAAGSEEEHLGYLLREEIIGQLGNHIAVTFALAWRGMFVSKYWSLVALLCFFPMLFMAVRRRQFDYVVFALPPWFMLGLHALISANIPRYNLVLIPCLAIASAQVVTLGARRVGKRFVMGR